MNYLIWSNEHRMWWRPASAGYVSDVTQAGRYTRDEAMAICKEANRYRAGGELPNELAIPEADAITALSKI